MPLLEELSLDDDLGLESEIILSQSSLQALSYCPRKFQYVALDRVSLPQLQNPTADLTVDLPQDLGTWFHRLLQQRELGLDITPLLSTNDPLPAWFNAFETNPPPMLKGQRESEQRRHYALEGMTLVGVYDLVILGKTQAQILDWKTYAKPQTAKYLQSHWQTRLYPYLLAQTSDYAPDQIVMTYWFAAASDQDHSLSFRYTQALFEQTQAQLQRFSQKLQAWITAYQAGVALPQVELSLGRCGRCEFAYRCQRQAEPSPSESGINPALLWESVVSYPEIAPAPNA